MTQVRWNPWSELDALLSGIDRRPRRTYAGASQLPIQADIYEDSEAFTLAVDLPGVKLTDVGIEVHEGVLSLSASRARGDDFPREGLRRTERCFGRVERSFRLPKHVNEEGIEASMSDGVLTIRLPKLAAAQPRKITISN